MRSEDTSEDSSEGEYDSYVAEYCENCGRLLNATDEIENSVDRLVHRVDIIEAIGPVDEVGETCAVEQGECECTGQIVKRWYAHPIGYVPETGYVPDADQVSGREPDEDALVDLGDGWKEVREVPGVEAGEE